MFRHSKPLLAALSLALIAFLVVVDGVNVSPGPLSTSHAKVSELSETSCDACHGDSNLSLDQACGTCHEAIREQVSAGTGFHGILPGAQDCGHCHREHFGAELPLVGKRAFALAGVMDVEAYAHEGLGFELLGKHAEVDCEKCHVHAHAVDLPQGEARYLGLTQQCDSCHEDPHQGQMVKSCQECHGQERPFAELANFLHVSSFPLDGVHGNSGCVDCHASETEFAVERLGKDQSPSARHCADCHETSHNLAFLQEAGFRLDVDPGATCAACHSFDGEIHTFVDYNAARTIELHGASGFELVAPHDVQACSECHTPQSAPNRTADDCAACHAGPHGDQFDGGPFAGSDCLVCHDRGHFTPASFSAEMHAPTGFALEDGHGDVQCADCHQVPAGLSLGLTDFSALESNCSACHLDVHGGIFDTAVAKATDCDTCHQTTTFAADVRQGFEHGDWTGFELSGAHSSADCESCHIPTPDPDDLGRVFGRVASIAGTAVASCRNCHANVHDGKMAVEAESCEDCHNTVAFAQVDRTQFDHGKQTGVELIGAHGRASCGACHTQSPTLEVPGRSFGFVSNAAQTNPSNCTACHEDPHKGRFHPRTGTLNVHPRTGTLNAINDVGCLACHNQETFRGETSERFDHGLWTGFPLADAHAQADCTDCHRTRPNGGLSSSKGKRCSDCHEDVHRGQLGATGCARCHSSANSFSELTFDHALDSDFALDDIHKKLACASCHQPWPLAAGGTTIRYKPLGMQCVDCHKAGPGK